MNYKILALVILLISILLSGCIESRDYIDLQVVQINNISKGYMVYFVEGNQTHKMIFDQSSEFDYILNSNKTVIRKQFPDSINPKYILLINKSEKIDYYIDN